MAEISFDTSAWAFRPITLDFSARYNIHAFGGRGGWTPLGGVRTGPGMGSSKGKMGVGEEERGCGEIYGMDGGSQRPEG